MCVNSKPHLICVLSIINCSLNQSSMDDLDEMGEDMGTTDADVFAHDDVADDE